MIKNKNLRIIMKSSYLLWALLVLSAPAKVLAQNPMGGDDPSEFDDIQQNDNPIIRDLESLINFLSIGVGVVVITVIIIGGIQYMTAGGNPQAVSAAKSRIINALIALVAFIFTFAFLQWLVPGGIFG